MTKWWNEPNDFSNQDDDSNDANDFGDAVNKQTKQYYGAKPKANTNNQERIADFYADVEGDYPYPNFYALMVDQESALRPQKMYEP